MKGESLGIVLSGTGLNSGVGLRWSLILSDLSKIWKPMETELQAAKERVLIAAADGCEGQVLNVEFVKTST